MRPFSSLGSNLTLLSTVWRVSSTWLPQRVLRRFTTLPSLTWSPRSLRKLRIGPPAGWLGKRDIWLGGRPELPLPRHSTFSGPSRTLLWWSWDVIPVRAISVNLTGGPAREPSSQCRAGGGDPPSGGTSLSRRVLRHSRRPGRRGEGCASSGAVAQPPYRRSSPVPHWSRGPSPGRGRGPSRRFRSARLLPLASRPSGGTIGVRYGARLALVQLYHRTSEPRQRRRAGQLGSGRRSIEYAG